MFLQFYQTNKFLFMLSLIVILFFIAISSPILAQTIEVKEITVSRVILKNEALHQEGEREGPVVSFKMIIRNNSDSFLILTPSNANLYLLYSYNGQDLTKEFSAFSTFVFAEKESIALKKNDSLEVVLSDRVLFKTPLLSEDTLKNGYDYSKEMLQILPTFRIVYYDGLNKMTSIGIGSVKLKDYVYTPR